MRIIGITGGIGAGKSTVSAILKELGAEVIDADLIARQVVEAGKGAYRQIVKEFGPAVLNDDQTLNRKMLADIVFKQPEMRRRLEAIVHAEVIRSMQGKIRHLECLNYRGLVVLDVPIPVKHGFQDTVDSVWVVCSDEEIRIRRVMARSGLSREEAKNRIRSQLSQEEYAALADEIIENDGGLDELRERVGLLVQNTIPEKE